jgi:predicted nucleotidyltransferase component of viral defense system
VKKSPISPSEHVSITAAMHVLALSAIAHAKVWAPGELAFQGGTALHLAYGSPRYSEDLDFIIKSDVGLDRIAQAATIGIQGGLSAPYPGVVVSVKGRDEASTSPRNPRMYTFTMTPPADRLGSVKVRLEFWVTDFADHYLTEPKSASIPGTRRLDVRLEQVRNFNAMVLTGTQSEILIDKIHAMACRDYPKPRDVFDLWLLKNRGVTSPAGGETWTDALRRHAFLYTFHPLERFPALLRARAEHFSEAQGKSAAITDLKRWLLDANLADQTLSMLVDQANQLVREVADRIEHELASGPPAKTAAPRKGKK